MSKTTDYLTILKKLDFGSFKFEWEDKYEKEAFQQTKALQTQVWFLEMIYMESEMICYIPQKWCKFLC